jgi:hypothetical protein
VAFLFLWKSWIARIQLSAASILRVIQRSSVLALQKGESTISATMINFCIRDEEYNTKI